MKIDEIIKSDKSKNKVPPPRNPVAVAAKKLSSSGAAGPHEPPKYSRKVKHPKTEY